jgi:enamine deaminase RidA (YjgF/YER057c/UK114 family)
MGTRFSEMTVLKTGEVNLIFIAGQVAENSSLDVAGQTREVLMIIDRLLGTAGADRTGIVSVRIFLASVGDYAAMNEVWDDWVAPGHAPARATVGAKLTNPEYKVEIEVVAAAPAVSG